MAVAVISSTSEVETGENAVLVIDLSNHYPEIEPSDPIAALTGDKKFAPPSLFHMVSMIRHAKNNPSVKEFILNART